MGTWSYAQACREAHIDPEDLSHPRDRERAQQIAQQMTQKANLCWGPCSSVMRNLRREIETYMG